MLLYKLIFTARWKSCLDGTTDASFTTESAAPYRSVAPPLAAGLCDQTKPGTKSLFSSQKFDFMITHHRCWKSFFLSLSSHQIHLTASDHISFSHSLAS